MFRDWVGDVLFGHGVFRTSEGSLIKDLRTRKIHSRLPWPHSKTGETKIEFDANSDFDIGELGVDATATAEVVVRSTSEDPAWALEEGCSGCGGPSDCPACSTATQSLCDCLPSWFGSGS